MNNSALWPPKNYWHFSSNASFLITTSFAELSNSAFPYSKSEVHRPPTVVTNTSHRNSFLE